LRTTVATARDVEAFSDCDDAILGADFNVKQALRKQAAPRPDPTLYGSAIAPITDIPDVIDACATALIPQIHDVAVQQKIREQTAEAGRLRDRINQLNIGIQPAAASKADHETRFVRRTIHTVINDLDLLSVGPVAVMDIAHIGPAAPGSSGLRYGPGGGIRLSIASSVNFTLGYAWNVNRQPGEGAGAVFFSIGVRDLFH